MKMKDTMTSNHCNNINPLSASISTDSSITSELVKNVKKKKKKSFFSKVKAMFSKSSTETQNEVSGPLHNAVKNTYVVRENHGAFQNNLQIYGQVNEKTNPENPMIYNKVDGTNTRNHTIKNFFLNDNLVNSANENIDSVCSSGINNSSWITTNTYISQGTETNSRDIFNENKPSMASPVDIGIQTKIPSCYKVYLLHKHVSNCNRRNKSNTKFKKNIFINRDKKLGGNKNYYYYRYSSTTSSNSDGSKSGEKENFNRKHWSENDTKTDKYIFNKSTKFYETNNIHVKLLNSPERFPRHTESLNTNSDSNLIIENDERTTSSRTPIRNSSSSNFESTDSQNLEYRKTKVKYKTREIQTNGPNRQEETNREGSQSLPSLKLLGKNKLIRYIKCNSSPLVSQNTIQTRTVKKRESVRTTLVKNSKNKKDMRNTVLQPFRNFNKKNGKNIKLKKIKSVNQTVSSSYSEEVSDSDTKYSNSASEIKEKEEIKKMIKIKAKGNQISNKTKLNKLKIKHVNSNSTITTDYRHTKKSEIITDDVNAMRIDKNFMKSIEHNLYQNDKIRAKQSQTYDQNDHFIWEKSDSLKSNRRPIITHPMIFFNENIYSETEDETSNYFLNKSFAKKQKKGSDENMKLRKKLQLNKSHSNLKIPFEHQYVYPYKLNYKHPVVRKIKKYKKNALQEPKKKIQNHKNIEIDNSISSLAINKQKLAASVKKNINSLLNMETNSHDSIKEKDDKKSNVRFPKNHRQKCIPQFGAPSKTLKKISTNDYTSWKPSSEILESSHLTEISLECNLKDNLLHKNKKVSKNTQKNWNENHSCNKKTNLENKSIKTSTHINQGNRMFHDILEEGLLPKKLSLNVGVHGAFSGNIASKRKTFFTKISPTHTNK